MSGHSFNSALPDRVAAMVSNPDEALAVMEALRKKFEIPGVDVHPDEELSTITRIHNDMTRVENGERLPWMTPDTSRMLSDLLVSMEKEGRAAASQPLFQKRITQTIIAEMDQEVFKTLDSLRSRDSFFLVRLTSSGGTLTITGPDENTQFLDAPDAWAWATEHIYRPMPKPGTGVVFSAALLFGNLLTKRIDHELEIVHH